MDGIQKQNTVAVKAASPTFEELQKSGLSEEDAREAHLAPFPELAHISHSSSFEDRVIAFEKLHKRLGIPPLPDHQIAWLAQRLCKLLILRLSLSIRAISDKMRQLKLFPKVSFRR
jgi:hypothetical protein